MWIKDSNGNWFMSNIDVFSGENGDPCVWDKDDHGNWFADTKIKNIGQVSRIAGTSGKSLVTAC